MPARPRAITIATGIPYRTTYHRDLTGLGRIWTPTMRLGTGCTVHMRDGELPAGRLIVSLSATLPPSSIA